MTIHIESLRFETIIGLLEFERVTKQTVVVWLEARYPYRQGEFINYADIVTLTQSHINTEQYILLEDALLGLKEHLLSAYPTITHLKLKIEKPDILPNCTVALSQEWGVTGDIHPIGG
jgi:7,8-dihydroneopterin aldolase/epimerase/oxygenase